MKNSDELPEWLSRLLQILCFFVTVALVYILMPHTGRVDRYFEIGKPWAYDLLMAPVDFPVYKTDERLAADRDSALAALVPYYELDTSVAEKQLLAFAGMYGHSNVTVYRLIAEQLAKVYEAGILPLEQMQQLQRWHSSSIEVVDAGNVACVYPADRLFTQKTAYDFIVNNLREAGVTDDRILDGYGIDAFVKPNLAIDVSKTEHAEREILSAVMLTSGMVQKGERIIDRGEVVTPRTYQILKSLQRTNEGSLSFSDNDYWNVAGDILIVVVLYMLLYVYFYIFRTKVLSSLKSVVFMMSLSLTMIALLSLVLRYGVSEYLVPFAMLPLVVRVFFDSRTALYIHIITVLVASQMVANPMEFINLQILAGMVAVASLKNFDSRGRLARSAAFVFLVYVISFTAIELSHGVKPADIDYWMYLVFFVNAVASMFAYLLIFLVEKMFGFLSSMTLVEISNINSPLLMEFSEKCPGTFQHVLQVSNLAVEVAKRVDADALLVRTGALYHDLGKMADPMYYTENQLSGFNPLEKLPYEEAAQIIISHVAEGVRIAGRADLPRPIVSFIASHHGTSKTRYFYNSYKNKFPDKPVDESLFTYPGPLPSTKEEAILMMSDAVEAASRSLKSYDVEAIDRMVESVIDGQIADGQFKNAPLSFRDVEVAKVVFKDKLKNIYHTRISYPELDKGTAKDDVLPLAEVPILNKIRKSKRTKNN
ncbi:MAG: HD family phosphohydrolase [Candidatus Aphodosoma sp.]